MSDPVAAGRYAQAIVSLAHREGVVEPVLNDLAAVWQLLERESAFARLLENPEVSVEEKRVFLDKLLKGRVASLALHLLHLLLWKGRLRLLPFILVEARQLRDRVEGISRGIVRSARPLPHETLATLRQRLERRLGTRVVLTPVVDPALIGGLSVQLDHLVFDGSVRRKLALLKERLLTRKV